MPRAYSRPVFACPLSCTQCETLAQIRQPAFLQTSQAHLLETPRRERETIPKMMRRKVLAGLLKGDKRGPWQHGSQIKARIRLPCKLLCPRIALPLFQDMGNSRSSLQPGTRRQTNRKNKAERSPTLRKAPSISPVLLQLLNKASAASGMRPPTAGDAPVGLHQFVPFALSACFQGVFQGSCREPYKYALIQRKGRKRWRQDN